MRVLATRVLATCVLATRSLRVADQTETQVYRQQQTGRPCVDYNWSTPHEIWDFSHQNLECAPRHFGGVVRYVPLMAYPLVAGGGGIDGRIDGDGVKGGVGGGVGGSTGGSAPAIVQADSERVRLIMFGDAVGFGRLHCWLALRRSSPLLAERLEEVHPPCPLFSLS